ncbi:MAG: hypothetical protein ACYDD1_05240 [Caulobacteraceae bacterium]
MIDRPMIIERAYQLARSGGVVRTGDIRLQLAREGYNQVDTQISGQSLTTDLMRLCKDARSVRQAV